MQAKEKEQMQARLAADEAEDAAQQALKASQAAQPPSPAHSSSSALPTRIGTPPPASTIMQEDEYQAIAQVLHSLLLTADKKDQALVSCFGYLPSPTACGNYYDLVNSPRSLRGVKVRLMAVFQLQVELPFRTYRERKPVPLIPQM